MKNYLNKTEQSHQFVLLCLSYSVRQMMECDGISEEERRMLKRVDKNLTDFHSSVFERLGPSYQRSIENKNKLNRCVIVSKELSGIKKDYKMDDVLDSDMLCEIIDQSRQMTCVNCKKESGDVKACPFYKIMTYLNYDGNSEDNDLCPFRTEDKEFEFDFEGEDL